MKLSLKERLVKYLGNQKDWIASGTLQRIVADATTYTPQNVGRRLRELQNEGVIEVDIRKGHAYYRTRKEPIKHNDVFKSNEEWFASL